MQEEQARETPGPVRNTDRRVNSFRDLIQGQRVENGTDADRSVELGNEADRCADTDLKTDLDVDALVALLDGCTQAGESRIKLEVVEGSGQIVSHQYHHGRCDIGSPWACGTAFDVLE